MSQKRNKCLLVEGSYTHELKIPYSWEFARFNEVIEIVGGSQPPKSDFMDKPEGDCVRLIQIRDYKSDNNIVYIPRGKAKRFVASDEVMIGRYGPPIFQILRGLEGAYNVALMKAKPRDGIFSNDYLYYYLSNKNIYNYVESASDRTAGQSGVNKKHLEQYPVGVPPLAEQKRIVEKLDEVLAQVDTIKARLDGIPDLLKRFRQSVLASAVSGKLTEEWRSVNAVTPVNELIHSCVVTDKRNNKNADKPFRQDEITAEIPASWTWVRLARITDVVSGVAKGSKTKSEVVTRPYLRVANVQRGYLDLSEIKEITVPVDKAESLVLKPGDILFNEGGDIDKLGRGWIWEGQVINCIHQNHVFRARVYSNDVESKYISHYGNSRGKEYFLREGTQSVNLANINKTTLSLLPVPLPPKEEQKEIVRLVDQYFAFADTIEAQVKKAQARVDNLTQSILAKAFRGELVPQNDGDEPAEVLLKRIAQARKEAEALAKAAKKAAKTKKHQNNNHRSTP
ncbi:type I restriction endonuclease subunit S [Vibrio parahaemolyticus]|nr:type I restriction endonuclease subunit S [Vibrio parahaemolyticus]